MLLVDIGGKIRMGVYFFPVFFFFLKAFLFSLLSLRI